MTIRKGESWGAPGALPADGVVVRSDAEATAALMAARHDKRPFPVLGLLGGDLCRTLGGSGDEARLRSVDAMTFSIDLAEVLLDGRMQFFVAHLVAHRLFWLGPQVTVMNAAWLGDLNLGPKAHPNDGLLDVSEGHLRPDELLLARRRARTGTHLPHPRITMRRLPAVQLHFDRPVPVWLDGARAGAFRDISARVEPDALTVVV
jgi:hypothetical protein